MAMAIFSAVRMAAAPPFTLMRLPVSFECGAVPRERPSSPSPPCCRPGSSCCRATRSRPATSGRSAPRPRAVSVLPFTRTMTSLPGVVVEGRLLRPVAAVVNDDRHHRAVRRDLQPSAVEPRTPTVSTTRGRLCRQVHQGDGVAVAAGAAREVSPPPRRRAFAATSITIGRRPGTISRLVYSTLAAVDREHRDLVVVVARDQRGLAVRGDRDHPAACLSRHRPPACRPA